MLKKLFSALAFVLGGIVPSIIISDSLRAQFVASPLLYFAAFEAESLQEEYDENSVKGVHMDAGILKEGFLKIFLGESHFSSCKMYKEASEWPVTQNKVTIFFEAPYVRLDCSSFPKGHYKAVINNQIHVSFCIE